jgi:enoyl-CoA hydratase
MDYQSIILLTEGHVATVRLNRPERMNAVSEEMYLELQDVLRRMLHDPDIRCLILTGSVLKRDGAEKQAFCAGADLKRHSTGERSPTQRRDYIKIAHDTAQMIYEFPKPVIAAVNGPARGAGTELALVCDLLLIAREATLGLPEAGLGTFVGGGITHLLPRLVGLARAKELVFTGRVVDGETAVALGMALACHPVARLLGEAQALAIEIAEKAPIPIAIAKGYLQRSPALSMATVLELEAEAILDCMESEDWKEGLTAFSEKRAAKFVGR